MEATGLKQLFNTSWTLHRLSPLHHSRDFETLVDNDAALRIYAARLRDQIAGDVLSGLQFGAAATATAVVEDDALSKAGALRDCVWRTIPPTLWASDPEDDDDVDATHQHASGIQITLRYDNVTYQAILLRGRPDVDGIRAAGTTYLPLLLTRLPTSLRQIFLTFLSSTFDTYCAQLRLPPHFLCASLETCMKKLSSSSSSSSSSSIIEDVIKDVQLTLSFAPPVAPALRTQGITVSRAALGNFLTNSATARSSVNSPFLAYLSSYLDKHLAMKIDLSCEPSAKNQPPPSLVEQYVRLTKVACGIFVVGSEGKVKLVAGPGTLSGADEDGPREEMDRFVFEVAESLLRALIDRAVPVPGERQQP